MKTRLNILEKNFGEDVGRKRRIKYFSDDSINGTCINKKRPG
jgi:hypothetical protein